ncbi:hypothetical protein [Runella sp. SP2]|uniref:hypothetical protein n=1 Tax=Runella sp. SP2 TaxID=2268026 RepID=UPI000F09314C|nr:hypothetical protein [Runella sp. SP2]AYQ36595.1 hypothetical protein DTQ70_30200 [Runella sp. SP2]
MNVINVINREKLGLVVWGRKRGCKVFFTCNLQAIISFREEPFIDANAIFITIPQFSRDNLTAYLVSHLSTYDAYTAYWWARDDESRTGFLAFTLVCSSGYYISNSNLKEILDELAEKYCNEYLISTGYIIKESIKEDISLFEAILNRYPLQQKPSLPKKPNNVVRMNYNSKESLLHILDNLKEEEYTEFQRLFLIPNVVNQPEIELFDSQLPIVDIPFTPPKYNFIISFEDKYDGSKIDRINFSIFKNGILYLNYINSESCKVENIKEIDKITLKINDPNFENIETEISHDLSKRNIITKISRLYNFDILIRDESGQYLDEVVVQIGSNKKTVDKRGHFSNISLTKDLDATITKTGYRTESIAHNELSKILKNEKEHTITIRKNKTEPQKSVPTHQSSEEKEEYTEINLKIKPSNSEIVIVVNGEQKKQSSHIISLPKNKDFEIIVTAQGYKKYQVLSNELAIKKAFQNGYLEVELEQIQVRDKSFSTILIAVCVFALIVIGAILYLNKESFFEEKISSTDSTQTTTPETVTLNQDSLDLVQLGENLKIAFKDKKKDSIDNLFTNYDIRYTGLSDDNLKKQFLNQYDTFKKQYDTFKKQHNAVPSPPKDTPKQQPKSENGGKSESDPKTATAKADNKTKKIANIEEPVKGQKTTTTLETSDFKSAQEATIKYEELTNFTMELLPTNATASSINTKISNAQKLKREFKKVPEFENADKPHYEGYIIIYIDYCDLALQILENKKKESKDVFELMINKKIAQSKLGHVKKKDFTEDLKRRLNAKFNQ